MNCVILPRPVQAVNTVLSCWIRTGMLGLCLAMLSAQGLADESAKTGAARRFQVEVNGWAVPVQVITINPTFEYRDIPAPAELCTFDFEGSAKIRITIAGEAGQVSIHPLSRGVTPVREGNGLWFELDRPGRFVIQAGGLQNHPLFLFANAPQRDAPVSGPGVKYFGPGVHQAGLIELESDQVLHLAEGARVLGYVRARGADNIRIIGRGILDGGGYRKGEMGQKLIFLENCRNVVIEGIICLDSPEWNINPVNCHDVLIENVKVIGWRRNSDAIDPVNVEGLVIRDCFLKGQDDGVTIKGRDLPDNPVNRRVTVEGTVAWNNWMRAFVVGGETHNVRIFEDIIFRDCDVIYSGSNPRSQANRDAALSIWNVDNATIEDVLFENIRVEEADRLVRIAIVKNKHSRSRDYGRIRNITFRNITALAGRNAIEISGHDADHQVENITFENLRIGGRLIRSPAECDYIQNPFVRNVRFIVTGE